MLENQYKEILNTWREGNNNSESILKTKLANFKIIFAFESNRIENPQTTYHDTREVFENGKVINFTGDLRTLYEIDNQKDCFEFLVSRIIKKEAITVDFIKRIHFLLTKKTYDESRYLTRERPGEFKIHDYVVGDSVGSYSNDVATDIKTLIDEVNQANADPLLVAAYFHLNFESIHPFADGNGRVGRTLMNYYLMIHDYPPTIIYDSEKETYYMALAVFDKTQQIDGFIEFLKEETIKTWTPSENVRKPLNQYFDKTSSNSKSKIEMMQLENSLDEWDEEI
ncbi:Fic family protein [Eubacterium aggregans]|uniref:Fic family protein n=1 Tax=Eubacterium aggregans TaxID=81409 RepID=UPI003F334BC2